MEKKTPLYNVHVEWGGKMVPFAGYLLPVQYQGIIEEHMAVREAAGLFDVSHMGEVLFTGADAVHTLNRICSNEFSDMKEGRVRYSPMLNPRGGVIDDLLVYKMAQDRYLMVVNAANREKDVAWILGNLVGDTQAEDISDQVAQLALQGPTSKEILTKLVAEESLPKGYYTFADQVEVAGIPCLISRTGYTGSFGYELYCKADRAAALWKALMEVGGSQGLIPCGLGARDTLRLEAGMPLYGHEMDDAVSPLETGLGFAVKMQKEDFIGKQALVERGEPTITRVGLKVTGRGIIREEASLFAGETRVGHTTSGTHLPYLKAAYAMALVDKGSSAPGTPLEAEVRGRRIAAEVVELPFYKG
jgi:aminomethyltransferase